MTKNYLLKYVKYKINSSRKVQFKENQPCYNESWIKIIYIIILYYWVMQEKKTKWL